ncbi:MAG: hypothetical protein D3906_07275 [Candidatus Electrothrix sp. AUS1_2]|nr:hypothetical protein [Candidatus Electrothrix sp. AUS1_2]
MYLIATADAQTQGIRADVLKVATFLPLSFPLLLMAALRIAIVHAQTALIRADAWTVAEGRIAIECVLTVRIRLNAEEIAPGRT